MRGTDEDQRCPLCEAREFFAVYTPVGSAVRSQVNLCSRCAFVGLVHSPVQRNSTADENFGILSCDADYSVIRVGKEQMLESSWKLICSSFDSSECSQVLDMSSARGHFVERIVQSFPDAEIACLEPDIYMTSNYENLNNVQIHRSIDQIDIHEKKFDLIYSCHSLEHYKDPLKNLRLMRNLLSEGGHLYVEVPNSKIITTNFVVEEFFYDHHNCYFFEEVLENAVSSVGLRIVNRDVDLGSLRLVLAKAPEIPCQIDSRRSFSKEVHAWIQNYAERLNKNRELLPQIVESWELGKGGKTFAIVGCGRLLDALVKYGRLDIVEDALLYDSVLSKIDYFSRRGKIRPLNELEHSNPDQVVIAAQSSVAHLNDVVQRYCPNAQVFRIA